MGEGRAFLVNLGCVVACRASIKMTPNALTLSDVIIIGNWAEGYWDRLGSCGNGLR